MTTRWIKQEIVFRDYLILQEYNLRLRAFLPEDYTNARTTKY